MGGAGEGGEDEVFFYSSLIILGAASRSCVLIRGSFFVCQDLCVICIEDISLA